MGAFGDFRRRIRSSRSLARLQMERDEYHEVFVRKGMSIPGEDAIRAVFRSRFPDRTPRHAGELNLLSVYHSYNWEGESLHPALLRFGSVLHYDWHAKLHEHGQGATPVARACVNRDLLATAAAWAAARPFDAIFMYVSGDQLDPDTVEGLRELGAPIVNLSLNDKESFVGKKKGRNGPTTGVRDLCRHFDLCWTSTRDALEKYCVEGAIPLYLPEGANPEIHRPYDVEKSIDVSFVGQCYENRPAVIAALRGAGIRVEAFGPGWPSGPLPTEEMVRTYSRSRINLGFGGVAGHKDTFHLKGRDFEVPMSGGLYLTEHCDELEGFFEIGKEIVTYRGIKDLIAKVRRLLADPGEAEAIRTAGRARALREHTWEMRFAKVFGLLGITLPRREPG